MKRTRPVLVVDNHTRAADDPPVVAVCVASLEDVGRTTSRLGSEAAGAATAEFAERLSGMLRSEDQLIQIHEAKHCLLIRTLKDHNHAALAGMKLERIFAEPFFFQGQPVSMQVRAGIACGRDPDADAESMFRAAETAREAARSRGTVYELADEGMVALMRQRWGLNDQVEEALFEHQLKLYYQPKVAADDYRLCGVEALLRWEHPEGLMHPGEFLPHLERDRMLAISRYVIRYAVRDLAAHPWLPPVSINLEPDLTEDGSLVELILDELTLWDVDPSRLVVEMTENGMIGSLGPLMEAFGGLRERGVRIAMDDFGTGNSSLAQFRNLLVDELKIDRSFVLNRESTAANRYLAGLIVDLGHYFGMTVVAEGVETKQVADDLRELSCDLLQGFYFSPPLPLDEFARWSDGRPGGAA